MKQTERGRLPDLERNGWLPVGRGKGEREKRGGKGEKSVNIGLCEITCVKLLKIVKHGRILRPFQSIKINY